MSDTGFIIYDERRSDLVLAVVVVVLSCFSSENLSIHDTGIYHSLIIKKWVWKDQVYESTISFV
jgi:hypothetical protein